MTPIHRSPLACFLAVLAFLQLAAAAPPPATRPTLAEKTLDAFVGRYRLPNKRVITVTRFRDQLYAQFSGKANYPIDPESDLHFTYRQFPNSLTFQADGAGRVTAVVSNEGKMKYTAQRFSDLPFDADPPPDTYDSPRLAALAADVARAAAPADRARLVDRFLAEVRDHAPLVEPHPRDPHASWVTFLYRGDSATRAVTLEGGRPFPSGDVNGNALTRLPGTDLWYRTVAFPNDTRTFYLFDVDPPATIPRGDPAAQADALRRTRRGDPLNPRWVDALYFASAQESLWSLLELPEAPAPAQSYARSLPGVSKGAVTEHKFASTILKDDRAFAVYVPADLPPDAKPCPVVILFDGRMYRDDNFFHAPTILDNLIAQKKIPPAVVVFVDQVDRMKELYFNDAYARYVAGELLPWVRAHYPVTSDRARTTVGGLSAGGVGAAFCALRHPDVFGNVLSQSGAFWFSPGIDVNAPPVLIPEGTLATDFLAAPVPPSPTRFYLGVGRFEDDLPCPLLSENRRLRDVLRAKGYPVTYAEYSGGHSFVHWRDTLPDALIALLSPPAPQQ